VLDPGGSVLYFKEGAMSDAEIENTLELMQQYITP
jgi:predicted transcriptional regulator